jgi:hypothetical protein
MTIFILFLAQLLSNPTAYGASLYKHTLPAKRSDYILEGAFYGGIAQKPTTLLNIRSKYSAKSHIQRFVFDLGDAQLKPLRSGLGAFHVALEKDPRRLVVDLSYVTQSALTNDKIEKIFAGSEFVKHVSAIQDPEDASVSLILDLSRAVAAEVYQKDRPGQPARLVIDLKESRQ